MVQQLAYSLQPGTRGKIGQSVIYAREHCFGKWLRRPLKAFLSLAQKPATQVILQVADSKSPEFGVFDAQKHMFSGKREAFPRKTTGTGGDRDKFRGSDHPEGGQTSQYKRDSQDLSGDTFPFARDPGTIAKVTRQTT